MGPEIAPIIVRKSRGYKGILMVMLAVLLMAIFALTLSEIAYNRQRDENFFRLQWAQLKHRLGYSDYGHRIIPVNQNEFELPIQQQLKQEVSTPPEPPKVFIAPSSDSQESSSSSSSNSQEQPNFAENFARDARLQFLRQILQRIKQNAEQMGFDGTMQVSVIEVEPQQMAEFGKKSPSEDPHSDSFLDSFGEFHAPPPFGHQGGPPPMREINENSIVPQQGNQNGRWPDFNGFDIPMPSFPQQMNFRPDMMGFRPPEWQRPDMMEEQWGQRRPDTFEIHPKSAEISSSPSQEVMGEIYGRKLGRMMLQDLIAARIQNSLMQQQQAQPNQMMIPNLVMPMRPSFPIEQQQPTGANQLPQSPVAPQQGWWSEPQAQFPQAQQPSVSNNQEQKQEVNQQPQPNQQMPSQVQTPDQFGQGFPQPQFPVFVSPEDRIQIEPPNVGASWQPPQQQPQQNADDKQMPPHAILDFMPPRAWTHQSESAPVPTMSNPMVDGESQPQQPSEESNSINEGHENRIVILKKSAVDGEKHEELGPSQLSDLPLKELQGQLAAAAAALSAQHNQDVQNREEQQRFDDEAKQKNMELQRPDADLFKSIEQPNPSDASQSGQQASEPTMVEIPEVETKQQPVEAAPITAEHNPEETSEQVDFPAVKFPNAPSADAPSGPMNDLPDQQQQGIFFQVDEPHNQPQQNMAGFA